MADCWLACCKVKTVARITGYQDPLYPFPTPGRDQNTHQKKQRWKVRKENLEKDHHPPCLPKKQSMYTSLRIIGPSYRGFWICIARFRDLQTHCFEIPWFLGMWDFCGRNYRSLQSKSPSEVMEPKYYAFWRWWRTYQSSENMTMPRVWGFLEELQYSTPWKIYMEPTKHIYIYVYIYM